MANEIQELLKEIKDERLRTRLSVAVEELRKTKKFGLVFEEHLPELLPIYSAKIRVQAHVARRDGKLTETFIVQKIAKGVATVAPETGGAPREIPVAELVVVKRFGEAIFPALRHVESVLRGGDAPHHTLIEADNYHALQLLEWLYAGKVDCIYIDPPYNTGARDWKYNNDYVDGNDTWRHSKWLAFMEKRLRLAHRLLKPDTGVLIVTIDEHEVHHLGMLLEKEFRAAYRQLVTIVITARGVAKQGLARVEEHAIFTYLGSASACATEDDFLTNDEHKTRVPWASLLRRGTNAAPKDRPGLVYPIHIDPKTKNITGVGESLLDKIRRGEIHESELSRFAPKRTRNVAWPTRSDGSLGTWQVKPTTLMELKAKGFAKVGRFDEERIAWSINYLKRGPLKEIRDGQLLVKGYEWEGGPAILEYEDEALKARRAKTVWYRTTHDAGTYGTNLLRSILGKRAFDFPKSLYSVRDTLSTVVADNPSALILDFFAGSGTTLNAVKLLNASDGGNRCCILVTNNEVSDTDAQALQARNLHPGDGEWEAHGICRSVTWPRCKFTTLGKRDDGTELSGEYLTGRFEEQEVKRSYKDLTFISQEAFSQGNQSKRKKVHQSFSQAVEFTKSKVTGTNHFLLAQNEKIAALFDPSALGQFLKEGSEFAEQIETVYLPFPPGRMFDEAQRHVEEAWSPLIKNVEVKQPISEGFAANLDYFRLDFLDRSMVETGGKLADILPALWMMANGRGKLPTCKGNEKMLFFKDCPFAVLVDESAIKPFLARLEERPDVDWAFLVTNDQDSFSRMCEWLPERIPAAQRIHLWRNYVDNFLINVVHPSTGDAP
ncbi:MAG: site-specific DNA-methyltransferase [Nitrospira sp.]|nr:site-specific DNA-methyltransferase [Nitrospira sp.]